MQERFFWSLVLLSTWVYWVGVFAVGCYRRRLCFGSWVGSAHIGCSMVLGCRLEVLEIEKPFEVGSKFVLADQWADWIPTLFEPSQFLTLTSREFVYSEALIHRYKFLVGRVNKMLYGNHWARTGDGICDVVGVEPQKRGVLHLHAVWDAKQVPYGEIHQIWNRISGYSWLEPVNATTGVAHYVAKYSIKGGAVSTYLSGKKRASL